MVGRPPRWRGDADGEGIRTPERDVPGPEAVKDEHATGFDLAAGGLVLGRIEPGRDPRLRPRLDGHVTEHDESRPPSVLTGVTGGKAGSRQHVVVKEEDDVAVGGGDPAGEGRELTYVLDAERDEPLRGGAQLGEDCGRDVARAVIDDDDLGAVRVVEQRSDEGSEQSGPVARRDDGRDRRKALVFLSWGAVSGRSEEIAATLGGVAAPLFPPGPSRRPHASLRYVACTLRTARLFARRPRCVIVTNPPVFAAVISLACGRLVGTPIALDTHPGGFGVQGDRVSARLQWLHRLLIPRVAFSLVASEHWARQVRHLGGRAVVVHEAPMFQPLPSEDHEGPLRVLCVGRFGGDEPVGELLGAVARLSDGDFDVRLTGDRAVLRDRYTGGPTRIAPERLVGFLEHDEYRKALQWCDVVLTLSTEPHSVMRAAYEAVYAGRPLVLSDWPLSRELFPHAVHVRNEAVSIARGLEDVRVNHAEVRHRCDEARHLQVTRWKAQEAALGDAISRELAS